MSWISQLFGSSDLVKEASNLTDSVFGGIEKIVDASYTSKEEKQDGRIKLLETKARIELEKQKIQSAINKIEAGHRSVFVAGWRPFIGWVSGISLGCYYVPQFVIGSYLWANICLEKNELVEYHVSAEGLMSLVTALLGMGGLRTIEKLKNKTK